MGDSCFVPSYLFITFLGSGALFIIQSFQNGVLTELFLDVQNGRLYLALLGKHLLFFPVFPFERLIVCEQVILHRRRILGCRFFIDDMVRGQVDASHQQLGIDNPVEKFHDGF